MRLLSVAFGLRISGENMADEILELGHAPFYRCVAPRDVKCKSRRKVRLAKTLKGAFVCYYVGYCRHQVLTFFEC